ncbi:hypothetical protein [Streptomyces griseosporeus]|uniref:hypothetical protein n=1 Tax=Streptomyces griseosporeus TaxID=1910 RepID=UPI0036FCD880
MTFPSRLVLAVSLLCGLYGVLLVFTGHALLGLPLILLYVACIAMPKPIVRQDPMVTALALQLRQAAESVPSDVHRAFRSFGSEHDVIVSRSSSVMRPHRFTVLTREIVDEAAALRPGSESFVTTSVYQVTPGPLPVAVSHIVEATRLVWGQEDSEPHEEPCVEPGGIRSLWRRLRMAKKTGVSTPSREDLERILKTIRTAEATDDQTR